MACRFDFVLSSNFQAKPVNRDTTQTDNYVCRQIMDDWATEPFEKNLRQVFRLLDQQLRDGLGRQKARAEARLTCVTLPATPHSRNHAEGSFDD
jgi:hypothetical protein